ncbi:MAG TPA: carbamoyl-phosphate synthase large subunit [bacterium]|nr:carbamoyl-phosphate synthase large subunit [bacterium]
MPKRKDIKKILIIGSGPIVIGQACEFDYSGTQAVKALKELGYETVLVNSNPATIMTDPLLADRTYVEPIRWETVAAVIEKERPDALLPTMGGQTSLNVTMELARRHLLEKHGVTLIGACVEAIELAEDRELFQKTMRELGLDCPRGGIARSLDEARGILETTGLPVIIRPAFTLGGTGGSMAYNREEYSERVLKGIQASPIGEVLIEESVAGWKEYELEVMRDLSDNVVIVCSVENVDPMGVHTGDSITVAPAQTLTDREYQRMRNAARAIIRKIGVETGGSNIQFAVNPQTGRLIVVEMNPRVSRSSALASKATGFPIAKIAARLAVGLNLDEIINEITGKTPACFEPVLDYVAVKIPRWNFEKFPQAVPELGPQMKAVGETMAIGRTFKEALLKAMRSLELDRRSFGDDTFDLDTLRAVLRRPTPGRLWKIGDALRSGMLTDEISSLTGIDPWFVEQIWEIIQMEQEIREFGLPDNRWLEEAKRLGLSDERLACLCGAEEREITERRLKAGILPVYKTVDTCAAEFPSETSCLYSTYEAENESRRSRRRRILILGSGPNRIGQGIEFDYCCVHAVMALRELGYETIMVNNNPETVSTDYDTADKLYFEPLTLEDVMHIVRFEHPCGVIVQFGGQTPLRLARGLEAAGVPILGTSPESIDLAEDRRRFGDLIRPTSIRQPAWGTAFRFEEALKAASQIGYPVLVRPSYVLGGRGIKIVYNEQDLERYIREAAAVSPSHPVLVDQFLEDALEFDVDALSDGNRTVICGCMQHIEEAGIHSGDSSCVLPPYMLADEDYRLMVSQTGQLASLLGVRGLMNVQFALKDGELFLLEVNPRASRTVPFVSKATGIAWAGAAARVIAGKNLDELDLKVAISETLTAVKTPVFPFMKFPNVQTYLSPEMLSTGEVMGMGRDFGSAFAKAQLAAGQSLPSEGRAFLSVNEHDKAGIIPIGRQLHELGFRLMATRGTHAALRKAGIPAECVLKAVEGRPNAVDYMIDGKIDLVINTPLGKTSREDEFIIGREAMARGIASVTTLSAAWAVVQAIRTLQRGELDVLALQDVFRE